MPDHTSFKLSNHKFEKLVINGPMISFGNFGTGKFLYQWRSHEYRNLKFSMNHDRHIANPPRNGLAGVVKNNFSKSGEALLITY